MKQSPIRFYQTGTFTVGNRLLDEEYRALQSSQNRHNSLTSGTVPVRGAGRLLEPATPSMLPLQQRADNWQPAMLRVAWKCSPLLIRKALGKFLGFTLCLAIPPLWPREWLPHLRFKLKKQVKRLFV